MSTLFLYNARDAYPSLPELVVIFDLFFGSFMPWCYSLGWPSAVKSPGVTRGGGGGSDRL